MRRTIMLLALAILVLSLFPLSCAKVQLNEITRSKGLLAEIPFQLHEYFLFVEIYVDGSAPLDFVFDAGAGGTLINAKTAARLGIVGDKTVSREGGGGMVEIVQSTNHIIDFGELRVQDITLGIAELDYNIEKRLGTPIAWVIGWPILSQYAVRIDHDAMLIEVYDNNKFDYDPTRSN
jgi:hypothetical protein